MLLRKLDRDRRKSIRQQIKITTHARIQKVFSEGVQLWVRFYFVFFSWLGERGSKYHYKRATIGLLAKRYLIDVSLACRWWLGSFVIFRGSRPVLLRNPIFLWFFRSGPPVPPLDPTMQQQTQNIAPPPTKKQQTNRKIKNKPVVQYWKCHKRQNAPPPPKKKKKRKNWLLVYCTSNWTQFFRF